MYVHFYYVKHLKNSSKEGTVISKQNAFREQCEWPLALVTSNNSWFSYTLLLFHWTLLFISYFLYSPELSSHFDFIALRFFKAKCPPNKINLVLVKFLFLSFKSNLGLSTVLCLASLCIFFIISVVIIYRVEKETTVSGRLVFHVVV